MPDQEESVPTTEVSLRGPDTVGESSCIALFAHRNGAWEFVGYKSDGVEGIKEWARLEGELGAGHCATFVLYAPAARARQQHDAIMHSARRTAGDGLIFDGGERKLRRNPYEPEIILPPAEVVSDLKKDLPYTYTIENFPPPKRPEV